MLTPSSEAINPVVLGKTRAKQYSLIHSSDSTCMLGDKVMCVQLHGDAAFTGQGVVMEALGLSLFTLLPKYCYANRNQWFGRQPSTFHQWRQCSSRRKVRNFITNLFRH